jgi:hypothetical protein
MAAFDLIADVRVSGELRRHSGVIRAEPESAKIA